MSISISSNVSDIQTDVTEKITNITNPTLVTNNGVTNTFTAKGNCKFTIEAGADFDTSLVSAQTQNIKQLTQVTSQTTLDADVMTALAQDSTASGSGLLSIGFAGAFNSATSIVTAGASISNAVSSAINTVNASTSGISCEDSAEVSIAGNWNASVSADQSLVTSQYVQSDQVAAISSSVSQSITQSATATMESVSLGALIVIGLIIILLVFGKPIIDAINRGNAAPATSTEATAAASAASAAVSGKVAEGAAAVGEVAAAAVGEVAAAAVGEVAAAAVGEVVATAATSAVAAVASGKSMSTSLNWYGALLALGGAVAMATGGLARQLSDPCNSSDQCRIGDDTTSTCSCTDHYTCGVNEDHTDVALPVSSPPQMFLFSIYEENTALLYNASLRRMAVRTFASFNSSNPLMSNSGWNVGVYVAMKQFCMTAVGGSVSATIPQRAMAGLLRCFGEMVQTGGVTWATDFGDQTDWNGLPNGVCPSALVDCLLPITPYHLHNKFLPPSVCATKDPSLTTCSASTLTDFQVSGVDDDSIVQKGAAAAIVDIGPTWDEIFGLKLKAGMKAGQTSDLVPMPVSLAQKKLVNIVGAAPNLVRAMCYKDGTDASGNPNTKFYERSDGNASCAAGFKPMWMTPSSAHIKQNGRALYKKNDIAGSVVYVARAPLGTNNTGSAGLGSEDGCTESGATNSLGNTDNFNDLAQLQVWFNGALTALARADTNASKYNAPAAYLNAPQCEEGTATGPSGCSATTGTGYTEGGMHFGFNSAQLTGVAKEGSGLVHSTVVCQQVQGKDTTDTVFYAQLPATLKANIDTNYSAQYLESNVAKSMGNSYDAQYCQEAMGLLRSPPDNAFDVGNSTSATNPAKVWTTPLVPDLWNAGKIKRDLIKPFRMSFPNSKYWDIDKASRGEKPYEFIPSFLISRDTRSDFQNMTLASIGAMAPLGNTNDGRTTILTEADKAIADEAWGNAPYVGVGPVTNCNFAVDTSSSANVRSCDGTQGIRNCWTEVLCQSNGGVWSVEAATGYGSCGNLLADDCSAACGNCKTSTACAGQLQSMNCQWVEASSDGQSSSYCAEGCSAAANKCSACVAAECGGNQLCQLVTWVGARSGSVRTACAPSLGSCGVDKAADGGGCTDDKGKLVPSLTFDWIVMRLPTPFLSGTGASKIPNMSACLPMVFTPSPEGAPFSYDDGSCSSGVDCASSVTNADGTTSTDCASDTTQALGQQSAVADASSIVGTCGYDFAQSYTSTDGNGKEATTKVTRNGCYESASAPCTCVDAAAAAQRGIVVDDAFRTRRYAQGRRIPNKVSPYCYFSALGDDATTAPEEKASNFVAIDNPSQEHWVAAQSGDAVKLSRWYYVNRILNSILLFNSDPTHFSVLGLSTFMNAGGFADDGQPLYPLTEAGLGMIRQLSATSSSGDWDVWVAYQSQPLLVQDASGGGDFQFYTLQQIDAFDAATKTLLLTQLQNFVYSKADTNWANVTPVSLARLGLGIVSSKTDVDPAAAQNALAGYSGSIFGAMGVCRTPYNTDALVYGGLAGGGVALALGTMLLAASAAL